MKFEINDNFLGLTEIERERLLKMLGRKVRHFKNKEYLVLGVVTHTETMEYMVMYKALYGQNIEYVRPIKMFLSEVDRDKYPGVNQKYRMELVED